MAARKGTRRPRASATPKKAPKYKNFGFRLYPAELKAIRRAARENRVAPSWYVKRVVLKVLGLKPIEARNVSHKARRAS